MTKNNTNSPYVYKKGLVELVSTLNGNERIHVGIRPYGFHAGNVVALVSYPKLLCEEYKRQYKKPLVLLLFYRLTTGSRMHWTDQIIISGLLIKKNSPAFRLGSMMYNTSNDPKHKKITQR